MTAPAVVAIVAGLALMALIWWPSSAGNASSLLMGSLVLVPRHKVRVGLLAAGALAALGFAAGQVLVGPTTGLATMILTGVGIWAIAIQSRSRRSLREADELAQLASGLANQAIVAPTVVEAVRQAAPLISGRVGVAAQLMASECKTGGLVEAANRFATTIQRPVAEMLSTVLTEAFRGGAQWVDLAGVLADEATEAAETARHFHRYAAALMPQVAVTVVMAVGMLAITGFAARDVGRWLTSPVGQQLLLLMALLAAALCTRVLAPAWRMSR